MKKILTILLLLTFTIASAQEVKPTYEKSDDMVKATYYYNDGSVKEQGFFKDKKLSGEWIAYDKAGNKTLIAKYSKGKKVGKWFAMNGLTIKEISYNENVIVSVRELEKNHMLAIN